MLDLKFSSGLGLGRAGLGLGLGLVVCGLDYNTGKWKEFHSLRVLILCFHSQDSTIVYTQLWVSEIEASRYKINPLFRISDRIHLNHKQPYRSFGIVWSISRCRIGKTYMFLRRCVLDFASQARVESFPWKWNMIQLLAWNVPQHLLLMTFSIAGSRVMLNTNLEQFLSRFVVANYILITRNYNT
jgi:hypothetical protein